MASSSSSSNPPPPPPSSSSSQSCDYDVFLSFCGKDTRKTFVGHLYRTLCDVRGIRTFKDNERLKGGKPISPQLLKAIEQSRSAVVVFSQNYASSSWCLDELVHIMDCELVVFPVFYDVDPSEVRRQSGTFGEGFRKAAERETNKVDVWTKSLHVVANCFRYKLRNEAERKVDVWRNALQASGNLSGYHLRNTADGDESECVKEVVDWCSRRHSYNISAAIDKDLIGMRDRVSKLINLLQLGRESVDDDVRMIGIWGMGGAGKTTLAEVTFHQVKNQFDGACFISNVREKSKEIDGRKSLQKEMLSELLGDKKLEVDSVGEGKEMIRQRLGVKKVLIVLDDVDDADQLHALAADREWFGKGSRILITTRDEHVLKVQEVDEIFGVQLLNEDEGIQLFSRHAFKKSSPIEGYNELSLQVVDYAKGLPLALKILGSFLCGRLDKNVWTSALKRLKDDPADEKIMKILQISYNGLEKQVEKEIFLDIACFFKGWKKDKVIRMLDSCGFNSPIGIDVLIEKSLISLSNDGVFQMHDLVQEMGRDIGRHNRLWRFEDIKDVLQNNTGTEAIEAIVGEWLDDDEISSYDSRAFMSMKKLRLLYLIRKPLRSQVVTPFAEGPGYDIPNELRWLHWEYYPHQSLPESFHALQLVGLEMTHSNIVQLWEGKKPLHKLTFLDLSYSMKLINIPDFSDIPNLIELKLVFCASLIHVHPSIVNLGNIKRLEKLDLTGSGVHELPSSIGHLRNLRHLSFLGFWKSALEVVSMKSFGSCLKELHLECWEWQPILIDVGHLSFLEILEFRLYSCASVPFIISRLPCLKILDLSGCISLKALPELPSSIAILKAFACLSLESIESLSTGKHKWLWKVALGECRSLTMHEKCDELNDCHKQEKSTMDHLLQSMLRGHAVGNYQFHILVYLELLAIPKWFREVMVEGNMCVLELSSPSRQRKIAGFAMCTVSRDVNGPSVLDISMYQGGNWQMPKPDFPAAADLAFEDVLTGFLSSKMPVRRGCGNVWMGYISLKMIRCSIERSESMTGWTDWLDTATKLLFTFDDFDKDDPQIECCAARVVYMDEVEEHSEATTSFSSSSSNLQQQYYDPNFAAETVIACNKTPGTATGISLALLFTMLDQVTVTD